MVAERAEGTEHSLAEKACICSAIECTRRRNIIINRGTRSGSLPLDSSCDANAWNDIEAFDSMGYLVSTNTMAT